MMWEDGRGVRRSVYGGDVSLVFSQIQHKKTGGAEEGETDEHVWTFSIEIFFFPSSPSRLSACRWVK